MRCDSCSNERDVLGFGTETIGTDAGQAAHFLPPYPCHYYMHGAGRYGLQCLTNLDLLPPTGSSLIAPPLKILKGSGSPLRVLALVTSNRQERRGHERSARPTWCCCRPNERTLPRMLELPGQQVRRPQIDLVRAADAWSFREARDIAAGRGATLRAAGVSAGDRVAILCANRLEMLEIILGCGWIGAIAVPINTAAMGPQIGYYLSNSGACLFAIEAQFVERAGACHRRHGIAAGDLGDRSDAPPSAWPSMQAMPPRMDAIAAGARSAPATRSRSSIPAAPPVPPRA